MDQAAEIYISRCNHAPCGDTVIHLFKGADSSANQQLASDVLVYIERTASQKNFLKQNKPERWTFIEEVWDVRARHMTLGLPSQYVFLLKCCSASDCSHLLCQQSITLPLWFPGGPGLLWIISPFQFQTLLVNGEEQSAPIVGTMFAMDIS